jgi:hypothetical protein
MLEDAWINVLGPCVVAPLDAASGRPNFPSVVQLQAFPSQQLLPL